jgi:hypothetical protein
MTSLYSTQSQPHSSQNGRINIIQPPDTATLFQLKDRLPLQLQAPVTDFREAMTGNWYNTILSNAFFSRENIQILQNGIRAGVYHLSKEQYMIAEQNPDELKVIMRSIFLQYSKNKPDHIKEQITDLNKLVLDYAIPQVYNEVVGYMKYKYDVSHMYEPISHPVMSKTNNKQLPLHKWF